jgi:hypothetical protein
MCVLSAFGFDQLTSHLNNTAFCLISTGDYVRALVMARR